MAGWGHAVDPYTIVEIDYHFNFETDPVSHPGKVALSAVTATALLFAKPEIEVTRTFFRKGIDFIPLDAWVYPDDVRIDDGVRLGLMYGIQRDIDIGKAKDNKESIIDTATDVARGQMFGSWSEYSKHQYEVA